MQHGLCEGTAYDTAERPSELWRRATRPGCYTPNGGVRADVIANKPRGTSRYTRNGELWQLYDGDSQHFPKHQAHGHRMPDVGASRGIWRAQ